MKAILTYHSLDGSGSPVSVAPEAFGAHLDSLREQEVAVVPLAQIECAAPEVDAVAITFDDGYRNFADEAWPRLKEHGFPATLFVVAEGAGRTNAWNGTRWPGIPELPLLDWDALRSLAKDGLSIGSHSRTHASLVPLDDAALAGEIRGARERIEDGIGAGVDAFAYPFGDVSPRVARAVGEHHRLAVTTRLDWLRGDEDRLLLPRIDCWYRRRPDGLAGFGRTGFRCGVRARAILRALRSRWAAAASAPAERGGAAAVAAPPKR